MPNNLSFLIVEDSLIDTELMEIRLKDSIPQFIYERVETEEDYIRGLEQKPDLILSDWSLPQFSGLQALKIMNERGYDIPFIIISGSIGEEAAIHALRLGAYDYILKDRPDRLGQAVLNALDQKQLREERKKAEKELKQEQYLMQSLMDTIPDAIYFKDSKSRFIRVNKAFMNIFNANDPGQVIGKTDFDFFGRDHAEIAFREEQEIIRSGVPLINIEELETYPNQPERWVSTTKMPLFDQNEEIIGTFGVSRDITRRKLAEIQILEAQQFAQSTINALTAHICVVDQHGVIIAINQAWKRFADSNPPIPADYCLGKNYLEVCDAAEGPGAEFAKDFATNLRKVLNKECDQFSVEYPCDVPGGEKRWFVARITRFYNGGPLRVVVAHENVTERKLSEEAVRESEEQYRSVTESANNAIITTNSEGIVVSWNRAAQKLFGYTADEIIGQPVHRLAPSRFKDAYQYGMMNLNPEKMKGILGKNFELQGVTKDGREFPSEMSLAEWTSSQKKYITAIISDISERKKAEISLKESEERYRKLVEESHDLIFTHDFEMNILSMNPAMYILLGLGTNSPSGLTLKKITPKNIHKRLAKYIKTIIKEGIHNGQWTFLVAKNEERIITYQSTLIDHGGKIPAVRCMAQDVTEKIYREQELKAIAAITIALRSFTQKNQIIAIVIDEISRLIRIDTAAIALVNTEGTKQLFEYGIGEWESWFGSEISIQNEIFQQIIRTKQPYQIETTNLGNFSDLPGALLGNIDSLICSPLISSNQPIGSIWLGRKGTFQPKDIRILQVLCDIAANAIRNADLYEQISNRATTLASLYDAGLALNSLLEPQALLEFLLNIAMEELHAERMVFLQLNSVDNRFQMKLCFGFSEEIIERIQHLLHSTNEEQGLINWLDIEKLPLKLGDVSGDNRYALGDSKVRTALWVPVKHGDNLLGVLAVMSTKVDAFDLNQERLIVLFSNQVAVALENANLITKTQLHIQRLESLHLIDETINASQDLTTTANVLLDQIIQHLKVDAACIWLFNETTGRLEFIDEQGFEISALLQKEIRKEQAFPYKDLNEIEPLHIFELALHSDAINYFSTTIRQQYKEYLGIPLISKGKLRGLLEIFSKSLLSVDPSWTEFMSTLASQAAIAIDNISMFQNLQNANEELQIAYDATIEGWSRAMDLRDKETEGHTQRVTEMTIDLAKVLEIQADQLAHIRRGALLHDIGKLGVPDQILLKPGPLNEDEWRIMKKHPEYAYEMLAHIDYLKPAIEIPFCHHEKWDGSGYPRGLKNNQIPLSARIFAVVDVWDALTNDRPYRPAWSNEEALKYIKGQSGSHFDPEIVNTFLAISKQHLGKNNPSSLAD